MEFLNILDMHFLLGSGLICVLIISFYFSAARRQNKLMKTVEISLQHLEKANQQSNLMLTEMRRTNRLMAELVGSDIMLEDLKSSSAESFIPENHSQHKLYVGNIDYTATESELAEHFEQYGQIEFVNIPVNRYNGRARGFGFVTFSLSEDAERAMMLNGSEFKGRQIQVNFAKEREAG